MNLTDIMLSKSSSIHEMLYESIYTDLKNRQNISDSIMNQRSGYPEGMVLTTKQMRKPSRG